MAYRAPVADIISTMRYAARLDSAIEEGLHGDLSLELNASILDQAGRFASDILAPLNAVGDRVGVSFSDGTVTTPPGWKEAYRAWVEAGWNAVAVPEEHGGQGLPVLLNAACVELWASAALAFSLCPLLTMGGIEALAAHATDELKARYLDKAVSGEWPVTMNLTEPAAGSDLSAIRTRAEPAGDGTYHIAGQKIFITYGEHDLADNILHLVLARLPDALAGTRGISMFLVPKWLPDGTENDLRCGGIEHKLGIHGSPTCTMIFGDRGGAVGWLVGEENCGLGCMFTMMNNARLVVALQGVAIGERSYQKALSFARERSQGRAPGTAAGGMSPIVEHRDVQRNLMTMKALTDSARAVAYFAADALDRAQRSSGPAARADAAEEAALLIPVAKAFATDIGVDVASIGIQVHGGMGFIEETGAAQYLRDARILPIYEGTNGIQAIDLAVRKLPLSGGDTVRRLISRMRAASERVGATGVPAFGTTTSQLDAAVACLARATEFMLRSGSDDVLASAAPYLRMFGLTQGGALLAEMAAGLCGDVGTGEGDMHRRARISLCRFYAENLLPAVGGLEHSVMAGAGPLSDAPLALAG